MRKYIPQNYYRVIVIVLLVLSIFLLQSCQKHIEAPEFDGERAFVFLEKQVELGPRAPGTPGWYRFHEFLTAHLDSLEISWSSQKFDYVDYLTWDTIPLINWIAQINPDAGRRILIAAHYDCRPRADYDSVRQNEPIPGANDGASGTAILMHLAELMITNPPAVGVDLVFFDGEDYGPADRNDQYLLGSRHFAGVNKTKYKFGLLLDMVGDRDLRIYREALSERYAPEINDLVWAAAAKLGIGLFVDSVKYDILDDHLSLISAGIPTIDIIDFDYPYWHTHADTPDKCDPASLTAVAQVVLEVIYGE